MVFRKLWLTKPCQVMLYRSKLSPSTARAVATAARISAERIAWFLMSVLLLLDLQGLDAGHVGPGADVSHGPGLGVHERHHVGVALPHLGRRPGAGVDLLLPVAHHCRELPEPLGPHHVLGEG